MEARSTVFDLARKLLRVGDRALLDEPLEALLRRLSDPVAKESLEDVLRAGLACTLREALEDDRLDRFASENCTQREEEALCHTLHSLLGGALGQFGDDDMERLAEVDEPEWKPAALSSWVDAHGLTLEIAGKAAILLHDRTIPEHLTLGQCAVAEVPVAVRGQSLLAASDMQGRARHFILQRARTEEARRARRALWQTEPPALLAPLRTRLLALIKTSKEPMRQMRFVPARPVQVDTTHGLVTGSVRMGSEEPSEVRLFLSGHEQRGLIGQCEACGEGVCRHVRALGARILDAVLDTEDRLHSALLQVAARPSWQRFVDILHQGGEQSASPEHGHLSFRLSKAGHRLSVSACLHRPTRNGSTSSGKVLAAARAMRLPAATDRDLSVLEAMMGVGRPLSTQGVTADLHLLRALSEHPRVHLGDDNTLVRVAESELDVEFEAQGDGLMPRVRLAGADLPRVAPPADQHYFLRHERSSDTLHFSPVSAPMRRLLGALENYRGVLPEESYEALGPFLSSLRRVAKVQAPEALRAKEYAPSRKLLLRLSVSVGDALHVALSSRPLPLGALWNPGYGPEVIHGLIDGRSAHARRDLNWERTVAKRVIGHLKLASYIELEAFLYRVEDTMAMLELLKESATLSEVLDIEWSEKAKRLTLKSTISGSDLNVRLWKRGHWLEIDGHALGGDAQVAVSRLLDAAKRGERFVQIAGRDYAEIEDSLLQKLHQAQMLITSDESALRLPLAAAPFLQAHLAEIRAGDAKTSQFLEQVGMEHCAELTALPPELLQCLHVELRPYQAEGIAWLLQLSHWAPGACLADDMGLGKTLQASALLCARRTLGPALVVAPTSVASNFCIEINRFTEGLRTLEYRGDRRKDLLKSLQPGDVVVVSYDLLQRDLAEFKTCSFSTQVIDEAQSVKNARTARAKAVRAITADFRVALSGTPVENRLGDLWSIFQLLAPGLLGPWARFRSLFAVPIERYEDRDRLALLRQLIAPFVLRRTKKEVESDLPERVEVTHRVDLSKAERELYVAAVERARENLRRRKKHEEARASHVLADLTQLRQLACHPRLVLERSEVESSKLHALLDILTDILPRGHRALIFSQFVRHLDLVREALDRRDLRYLYLDGSTPAAARPELVAEFQAGAAPLFLISLKAGGTGLTLTAADYVFHLDPWWNPAAEDQASDRAHRIGQERPVTIVKLVAADTIEERVHALHAQKRQLASGLFDDRGSPVPFDLQTLESLVEQGEGHDSEP